MTFFDPLLFTGVVIILPPALKAQLRKIMGQTIG